MTDLHSHILYGIDDGVSNINESLILLLKLTEAGFNNVILTPHYIEDTDYSAGNIEKQARFEELKNACIKNNIKVNLFLGNEVYINNNIIQNINDDKICTLNNSKYLLFELPLNNQILNLFDIIHEIKLQGYIPILAHPERYIYFQKDYNLIDELKNEGVLLQANYGSILGYYGRHAKRLLKYMLKRRYVDFMGTDIHKVDETAVIDNFSLIKNAIIKITGEEYFNKIIKNGDSILKEDIK